MALYLPSQHIAFEVVDDPCSSPVDAEAFPGITVVKVTSSEITRPDLLESLARGLRRPAGTPPGPRVVPSVAAAADTGGMRTA